MKRWYNEIPAIKNAFPEIAVMSCHDEWLLPTMFDIDGLLVGYGNMAPELLIEYLAAGKAQDYPLARKYHEQLLPITRAVYHRGSHMEGSVALKHALRARGLVDNVNVREPLKPLGDGADEEIRAAVKASGLTFVARGGRRLIPASGRGAEAPAGTTGGNDRPQLTPNNDKQSPRSTHRCGAGGIRHAQAHRACDNVAVPRCAPRRAPTSTTWAQKLALIGPAFIAGAWQFGPGNLTSAVEAGSAYGYALVWVIAVSTLLMIFFTDMSVRIGIAAPGTMIATIKRILGKPWGVVAGLSVFFITLCFSVGNAAGSGLALSMLFGGSALLWTAVCTIGVAFVLLMRNIYTAVERILLVLVAMMAVGFIASAFLAGPDWGAGVGGMVPSFPPGAELLIIALVGTNFSINAAFFTSYATRERGIRADQYRDATITDTIPGIVAPGIMTCLVIMVAAAVLGHTGEKVTTLVQLANVFEPLAGKVGSTIFVVGFFGAAFSSMLANATAGGTLLADGLGAEGGFNGVRSKLLVACVLGFGLFVVAVARAPASS